MLDHCVWVAGRGKQIEELASPTQATQSIEGVGVFYFYLPQHRKQSTWYHLWNWQVAVIGLEFESWTLIVPQQSSISTFRLHSLAMVTLYNYIDIIQRGNLGQCFHILCQCMGAALWLHWAVISGRLIKNFPHQGTISIHTNMVYKFVNSSRGHNKHLFTYYSRTDKRKYFWLNRIVKIGMIWNSKLWIPQVLKLLLILLEMPLFNYV